MSDSFICVKWLANESFICTYSYVWWWLIHMYLFICLRWLIHIYRIHTCEMTHSCVTWLIHMYDLNHPYMWGELCDFTHPHVWLDSSICAICICADIGLFCEDVGLFCGDSELFWGDIGLFHGNMGLFCKDSKSYIHMYDLTHPYVWLDSSICAICMTQHMYLYVWYVWLNICIYMYDICIHMSWHMYPYVCAICIHTYDLTHPYMVELNHPYVWVELYKCMCWHVCVDT